MNYEIIRSHDPRVEEYAGFVRNHRNCHFLQDPQWARVKDSWRWVGILALDDDTQIRGVISVLLRPLPLGFQIAYAPRGPVCCRTEPDVMSTLMEGVKQLAKDERCMLTYMDPDEPEGSEKFKAIMHKLSFLERKSDDFGGVQPQSVFRLSLAGQTDGSLLSAFAPKTRYNIRLALRKGVQVRKCACTDTDFGDSVHAFSTLMKITGERDHFLVRGEAYFTRLLYSLGPDAALYLAELEGMPIAGAIAIYYGDKAWYLYGASSNEHRGVMPNYLLQWTMIQEALRRHCGVYDFRGVPGTGKPDDPLYGLYRFKMGFSGVHTRFAGLFICFHRPILGRLFDYGQSVYRKIRRISAKG